MARIRSIKPEFATSEAIAELRRDTRLHFALLWTHADDQGRGVDNPKLIKAACWPLDDDVTAADVESMQAELAEHGFLIRYEVDGRRFFAVDNWGEHQKPQHPKESKLPPPPDQPSDQAQQEPSGEPHDTDSTRHEVRMTPQENISPVVGVGEGEGTTPQPPSADTEPPPEPADPSPDGDRVREIFDAWVASTGRSATRTKLDAKRRRRIRAALKDYPAEDLVAAVRGWRHSPHHRGENDRSTTYNDLELLLRDATHIERFRDLEMAAVAGSGQPSVAAQHPAVSRPQCDHCSGAGVILDDDGLAHDCRRCKGPELRVVGGS